MFKVYCRNSNISKLAFFHKVFGPLTGFYPKVSARVYKKTVRDCLSTRGISCGAAGLSTSGINSRCFGYQPARSIAEDISQVDNEQSQVEMSFGSGPGHWRRILTHGSQFGSINGLIF